MARFFKKNVAKSVTMKELYVIKNTISPYLTLLKKDDTDKDGTNKKGLEHMETIMALYYDYLENRKLYDDDSQDIENARQELDRFLENFNFETKAQIIALTNDYGASYEKQGFFYGFEVAIRIMIECGRL